MLYARTPQQGNGRVEQATTQSTDSTTNCPHAYANLVQTSGARPFPEWWRLSQLYCPIQGRFPTVGVPWETRSRLSIQTVG